MSVAGGGKLTVAGGLGLVGGGSADTQWLDHEFAEAGNPCRLRCITWALADQRPRLDVALVSCGAAIAR